MMSTGSGATGCRPPHVVISVSVNITVALVSAVHVVVVVVIMLVIPKGRGRPLYRCGHIEYLLIVVQLLLHLMGLYD